MKAIKLLSLILLATAAPAGAAPDLGVEPVIPGGRDAPAATRADWCQGFVRGQKMDVSLEPRQRGVTDNLGSVAWFACEQDTRWTRAKSARDIYLAAFPGLTAHDFSEVMAAYRDLDKAQARDERMCGKLKKAATDLDARVRYAISCDWKQLSARSVLALSLDRPGDTGSVAVRAARRFMCQSDVGSSTQSSTDGRCPDEMTPISRDELERDLASRPMLQRIDMREAWSIGNTFGPTSKARIASNNKDYKTVAVARTKVARAWADEYAANPGPIDEAFAVFAKLRAGREADAAKGCSETMVPAFRAYLQNTDVKTEPFVRAVTSPAGRLIVSATRFCALVDKLPLGLAMTVTEAYGALGAAKGKDENPLDRLEDPSGPRFDLTEQSYEDELLRGYSSPDIGQGVIESVKKKGKDKVILAFKRERISVPEQVMAAGDIDGIDKDGRFTRSTYFRYTGRTLKVDVTTKPVEVSAAVAKSLKVGLYLRVARMDNKQTVVMVAYPKTSAKTVVMFADTPTR